MPHRLLNLTLTSLFGGYIFCLAVFHKSHASGTRLTASSVFCSCEAKPRQLTPGAPCLSEAWKLALLCLRLIARMFPRARASSETRPTQQNYTLIELHLLKTSATSPAFFSFCLTCWLCGSPGSNSTTPCKTHPIDILPGLFHLKLDGPLHFSLRELDTCHCTNSAYCSSKSIQSNCLSPGLRLHDSDQLPSLCLTCWPYFSPRKATCRTEPPIPWSHFCSAMFHQNQACEPGTTQHSSNTRRGGIRHHVFVSELVVGGT